MEEHGLVVENLIQQVDFQDNDDFFDAQDLIYNRFDIIYCDTENGIRTFTIMENSIKYELQCHYEKHRAIINAWGKRIPSVVMERFIDDIATDNSGVGVVYVQRMKDNYKNLLMEGEEAILKLPSSQETLLGRLTTKERSHLRQYEKHLNQIGKLKKRVFDKDIPDLLVNHFFEWKYETHGRDYGMRPQEYLDEFHVTHAMGVYLQIESEERCIACLFWSQVNRTVFFENFSYDRKFKKYSPGFLIYTYFLEELIENGCNMVFLGGAGYSYKRKFGTLVRKCYSGYIYTETGKRRIKEYLKSEKVCRLAIWGGGKLGKAVLECLDDINVKVCFIIDKNKDCIASGHVYLPHEEWPQADFVLITMMSKNVEVEEMLRRLKMRYSYYYDLVNTLFNASTICDIR